MGGGGSSDVPMFLLEAPERRADRSMLWRRLLRGFWALSGHWKATGLIWPFTIRGHAKHEFLGPDVPGSVAQGYFKKNDIL